VNAGRIQLKDLLRDAESRLTAAGLTKAGIGELLAPARELARETDFWRYQSDGIAVYLAHGFFRYFRLPLKLTAFVTVAERFDVAPLLPVWTAQDRFYLLALSRKQAKLFEATRFAISELGAKGLPESLPEVLGYAVDESARQQHTLKPGLPEDELLYFRQIDAALRNAIPDQRVPLVLAGVEEAVSLHRQANTYATLLDGFVAGNPDRLGSDELHAKAVKIAQAHYDQLRNQAAIEYKERRDATRTSNDLNEILPAAFQGRVFYLFVGAGAEKWGRFDPEQNAVLVHESAERGDQELLNLAVIQTILNGGSVYALAAADVPDGGLLAAVFRY